MYLKMEEWTFGDNRGLANPAVTKATRCPADCGLCNMHTSHTGLANVDLTNRCNLTCPVCFANANAAGYLYEPDFETVRKMLQALRNQKPVPAASCSFRAASRPSTRASWTCSGWPRRWASPILQAATNGIKFTDLEFAQQCKEAGLHTLYLQFDGVCDDVYRRTRGESLWEKKMQCIENVRKAGLKIVYVPTIVKGVNEHQIGDILRLALEYIECSSGISFQPVAFTGRIARHELEAKRFTLSDFAHAVEAADGHRQGPRRLVPALLRDAVLEADRRLARRGDHHAELPSALLAGHLPVRGPEPQGHAGDAVRGRGSDAAGDGHAGAQGRQAPRPVLHQDRSLEQPAQVLPRGQGARRPDVQEVPANPARDDGQEVRPRRKRSEGFT